MLGFTCQTNPLKTKDTPRRKLAWQSAPARLVSYEKEHIQRDTHDTRILA